MNFDDFISIATFPTIEHWETYCLAKSLKHYLLVAIIGSRMGIQKLF